MVITVSVLLLTDVLANIQFILQVFNFLFSEIFAHFGTYAWTIL